MTDANETDGDPSGTADGEGGGDRTATPGASEDPGDEEALAARVEALESEVARLADVVDRQRRTISFLTVDADLEPLDPAECPDCGERALTRRSGLTWSKALCTSCGADWVLSR